MPSDFEDTIKQGDTLRTSKKRSKDKARKLTQKLGSCFNCATFRCRKARIGKEPQMTEQIRYNCIRIFANNNHSTFVFMISLFAFQHFLYNLFMKVSK